MGVATVLSEGLELLCLLSGEWRWNTHPGSDEEKGPCARTCLHLLNSP